ncbi:MAG: hypothetical protein M1827_004485 [Pycnora praestabilis]|nr:MAG: hypothetical protein M1827_004485 [Pycnora praestabilis]
MAKPRSRAIAVIYNTLCAYLSQQFPDDPYHLALNFSTYSHFASILSLLGFIGALREHAFSVAIFAIYLIIDTILCSIPRFLIMTLFSGLREDVCSPDYILAFQSAQPPSPTAYEQNLGPLTEPGWSHEKCLQITWILQSIAFVVITGATMVQFAFALQVRDYANSLYAREQAVVEETGRDNEKGGWEQPSAAELYSDFPEQFKS